MESLSIIYGTGKLPLRIGHLELPCYILSDGNGVFTRAGLQKALGYDGKSPDWLFDLLGSINKFYPVSGALFEALENPILFEMERPDGSLTKIEGIYPSVAIDACKTILNAKNDGYLSVGQLKHAKAAALIDSHFEAIGPREAIEEATGFNFTKETGKIYLRDFMLSHHDDAVYHWIPALRDTFFEALLEMHALDWHALRKNPKKIAELLHECLFSRFDDQLNMALRAQKPKRVYRRPGKMPKNHEHPELQHYVSEIMALFKAAASNWSVFLQLANRIHPKTTNVSLTIADPHTERPIGLLDSQLQKAVAVNRIYTKHNKKRA